MVYRKHASVPRSMLEASLKATASVTVHDLQMQERATLSKKLVEEAAIQEQERDEAHRFAGSAEDEVHLLQTASKLVQEAAHENRIVHDLRLKVRSCHCTTYNARHCFLLHSSKESETCLCDVPYLGSH